MGGRGREGGEAYMFTDFFVRLGGTRRRPAFRIKVASKARDARIFCMRYSEKWPLAIWLRGGNVGGWGMRWLG